MSMRAVDVLRLGDVVCLESVLEPPLEPPLEPLPALEPPPFQRWNPPFQRWNPPLLALEPPFQRSAGRGSSGGSSGFEPTLN